jgi:hypothetical protein
MNTRHACSIVGLAVGAILSGCAASDTLTTFSTTGITQGGTSTREACQSQADAVWVVVDGAGDCIRYYPAGLRKDNRRVVVFLHGDMISHKLDKSGRTESVSYIGPQPVPDRQRLLLTAGFEHEGMRLPYVYLARPGVLGSSGDHKERRRPREVNLVNGALEELKGRHRIERFALTGQSGGGHLVASLLALRGDIECAVITSGAVSVRQRNRLIGIPEGQDVTGYRDFVDPIDWVDRIPNTPGLRIFVIGDERDSNAPFETQRAYYEALRGRGLNAYLGKASGTGRQSHGLAVIGHRAVSWCAHAIPAEEILDRVLRGDARYQ